MRNLLTAGFVCSLLWPALAGGGDKGSSPLTAEHRNAAATFTLSTPPDWTFESHAGHPEVSEARGDGLLVRIVRQETEMGLDAVHVECMLRRLAPPMETSPQVEYEYDFVLSTFEGRQAVDSAFVVHYDDPIDGQRDWRQRNLTVVGGGESLCLIGYTPLAVWKKQKAARKLLNSVIESVRF
jgi:hypothetical protein